MHAQRRRLADGQVQVAGLRRTHGFQQTINLNRSHNRLAFCSVAVVNRAACQPNARLNFHATASRHNPFDLRDLHDFLGGGDAVQHLELVHPPAGSSCRWPWRPCGSCWSGRARTPACGFRCSSASFRRCRCGRGNRCRCSSRSRAACRAFLSFNIVRRDARRACSHIGSGSRVRHLALGAQARESAAAPSPPESSWRPGTASRPCRSNG